MSSDRQLVFAPFRLDLAEAALYREMARIPLRGKAIRLLCFLAQHANRTISKKDLLRHVWANARVLDAALKVTIGEVRKALGDNPAKPNFIATVGRDGYRFIAPLRIVTADGSESSPSHFVGRQSELESLEHYLALAASGKRQFVFVTGEAGIGKTTLVQTFANNATAEDFVIAHGQGIEQYGAGEAYLPILDIIERLCKSPAGGAAIEALRRCAPSWLASLPALIAPEERAELARQTVGTTPERRLREIASWLEETASTQTLLLVLEDLHWLDPSTLALIAYLARRREAARLMVIGTYRDGETPHSNQPLKNLKAELQLHGQCAHLPLKLFTKSAVADYLATRFETATVPARLLSIVYRRSEGNPLLMVNVTDYLVERDAILREQGSVKFVDSSEVEVVPDTIRDLIERQLNGQSREDQELLDAASVAGTTFAVAAIARALGRERQALEEQCRELARREQFLQPAGSRHRPNGRGTSQFRFLHALYQNVIYQRIAERKRAALHRFIGERLEVAYDGATDQVAAELALHFERGGDDRRAVKYLLASAHKAVGQCGYEEAVAHASAGLRLIKSLPESAEGTETQLTLQLLLSLALTSAKGYAASDAADAFQQARTLCRKVGKDSLLIQALTGIWAFNLMRGEFRGALALAKQILAVARASKARLMLADGHMSAGVASYYLGNALAAQHHFDQSLRFDSPDHRQSRLLLYGWDTRVVSLTYGAGNLWLLGDQPTDMRFNRRGLSLAQTIANPLNLVIAQAMLAGHHQLRREPKQALACAESALEAAREFGFVHWIASASITSGWSLAATGRTKEGIDRLIDGLALWRATGARAELSRFMGLLADAYLLSGQIDKGLQTVAEALAMAEQTGEGFYLAELHRLNGELLLGKTNRHSMSNFKQAEGCFLRAVSVARRQKAKSLELRAALSLARLWQRNGSKTQARRILSRACAGFKDSIASAELAEAKAILNAH